MNAEEYCRQSAEDLFQQQAEQADDNFWQKPKTQALLDKRKDFIKRVLVQIMKVLQLSSSEYPETYLGHNKALFTRDMSTIHTAFEKLLLTGLDMLLLQSCNSILLERNNHFDTSSIPLQGLQFAHDRNRVHQRLLPGNVLLSCSHDTEPEELLVQLQNFSLAADISDSALIGGATLAEIWNFNQIENADPL